MSSSGSSFSNAEAYEAQMGRWSRRLAEAFLDFAGPLGGDSLLDVGCGTGSLTFAMARRAKSAKIAGVDLTPAFIDYAATKNEDPRIEFRVGDACSLPFPDQSFDHTLSLLCLHFVADPEMAISEMRRVTRPGGTIAAAVWDTRGGFISQRMFFDTAAALDPRGVEARAKHFTRRMCRPGELEVAFVGAGLRDVEPSTVMTRMEYASFDDYWRPFLGRQAGPASYVASLEPAAVDELREAVRLAYLDGDPNGPRSHAAIAWAAKGRVPA